MWKIELFSGRSVFAFVENTANTVGYQLCLYINDLVWLALDKSIYDIKLEHNPIKLELIKNINQPLNTWFLD